MADVRLAIRFPGRHNGPIEVFARFPKVTVVMGRVHEPSLGGLGPYRIETVSERLEAARCGSVDELGELLEACRAYLLLVAKKTLSPNLRAKGGDFRSGARDLSRRSPEFQAIPRENRSGAVSLAASILAGRLSEFSRRYFRTTKRHVGCESPREAFRRVRPKRLAWPTIRRRRVGLRSNAKRHRPSLTLSSGCRPITSA